MDTGSWWYWALLLGVVLPIVVMVVLAVLLWLFGRRWVEGFIEPDGDELLARFQRARQDAPTATAEELIAPIVRRQALKCGVAGAITGLGGFVTLPLTLPVDMLLTARYQAEMVSFIAFAHGYGKSVENKAATYAVLTGGSQAGRLGRAALAKYLPQALGKGASKFVPILGAVVSFVVNYWLARGMARAALAWYGRRPGSAPA